MEPKLINDNNFKAGAGVLTVPLPLLVLVWWANDRLNGKW
jgi:hypothetical protein